MDTQTQERNEASRPLGVIGCLRAGFEVVGLNLWLVTLPVLVDLFLWLGPRLSIAPLVHQVVSLLRMQPPADPEVARQMTLMTQLLEQLGQGFNLFSLLSGLPLLTIPSLLVQRPPGDISPLGHAHVLLVRGTLSPMAWTIVLTLAGLALGILYLSWLARRVHVLRSTGEQGNPGADGGRAAASTRAPGSVGGFLRAFFFSGAVVAVGMIVTPLWLLFVAFTVVAVPALGFLIWAAGTGLTIYVVLHLLFIVHGVLLGGRGLLRAIWESVLLTHVQLPSVMGLVVLAFVIYQGLGFVWSLPSGDSWALLIGILGNACIATGLTAATFVFYQERIGRLAEWVAKRRTSVRA